MATSVATRDGERTNIDDAALEQFRTTLRGDLLKPADPGYADKPIYNAMHRHRPALIVRGRPMWWTPSSSPVRTGFSWPSAVEATRWPATRAAMAGWSSI